MKQNYICPTHIWDIRDPNLDCSGKALLNRLVSLQHLTLIYFSNQSLADDLGVTKQTIVLKMKLLVTLGYIKSRCDSNLKTQTKFTELRPDFIRQQILTTAPDKRRPNLMAYYEKQILDEDPFGVDTLLNAM